MVKIEIRKKCPRCNEYYTGHPALSRADNKTKICSKCGESEAMISFALCNINSKEIINDRLNVIGSFISGSSGLIHLHLIKIKDILLEKLEKEE